MPLLQNNRDLLDRFRRGERTALAEVYEHYVDRVADVARRGFAMEVDTRNVVVPGLNAEGQRDVVQETFAKAFAERARLSYDGLRPYRPFLLRVTKNLMIDRYRRGRRRGRALDVTDEHLEHALLSQGHLADADELRAQRLWSVLSERTRVFLSGLDDRQRSFVRLRYEEELSQEEVAKWLKCSRRRVRTLERAIQKELLRFLQSQKQAPAAGVPASTVWRTGDDCG